MKNTIKIKENLGRSMVEMLGVLAVIGVLTIGGIAGFKYAMDKWYINEISNAVRTRAMVVFQQRQLNRNIDLSEFHPTQMADIIINNYEIMPESSYRGDSSFFVLTVKTFSKRMCRLLLQEASPLTVAREIRTTTESILSECQDDVMISYIFSNDLQQQDTPKCSTDEYEDANGTCRKDNSCPYGSFSIGKNNDTSEIICSPCPTEGNSVKVSSRSFDTSCTKCSGGALNTDKDFGALYCIYCPQGRETCLTTCCPSGYKCEKSVCSKPECYSDSDCPEGKLCNYVSGRCTSDNCRTNDDCKEPNTYCLLNNSSTYNSCTKRPGRGTCITIESRKLGSYTASTTTLDFFNAENFCEALGKKIVSPFKLCSTWADIEPILPDIECSELHQIPDTEDNWYWVNRARNTCVTEKVNFFKGMGSLHGNSSLGVYALCE